MAQFNKYRQLIDQSEKLCLLVELYLILVVTWRLAVKKLSILFVETKVR